LWPGKEAKVFKPASLQNMYILYSTIFYSIDKSIAMRGCIKVDCSPALRGLIDICALLCLCNNNLALKSYIKTGSFSYFFKNSHKEKQIIFNKTITTHFLK